MAAWLQGVGGCTFGGGVGSKRVDYGEGGWVVRMKKTCGY